MVSDRPRLGVVLLERVEQPGRPAGVGRAARPGRGRARRGRRRRACRGRRRTARPGGAGRRRRTPAARRGRSPSARVWLTCTQHDVGRRPALGAEKRLRSIPITGVMPEPAVTSSSLRGIGVRQHELALGLLELDHLAGPGAVHEVVGDDAARDRLDGEADAAVGGAGRGSASRCARGVRRRRRRRPGRTGRARGRPSRGPA